MAETVVCHLKKGNQFLKCTLVQKYKYYESIKFVLNQFHYGNYPLLLDNEVMK